MLVGRAPVPDSWVKLPTETTYQAVIICTSKHLDLFSSSSTKDMDFLIFLTNSSFTARQTQPTVPPFKIHQALYPVSGTLLAPSLHSHFLHCDIPITPNITTSSSLISLTPVNLPAKCSLSGFSRKQIILILQCLQLSVVPLCQDLRKKIH